PGEVSEKASAAARLRAIDSDHSSASQNSVAGPRQYANASTKCSAREADHPVTSPVTAASAGNIGWYADSVGIPVLNQGNHRLSNGCSRKNRPSAAKIPSFESRLLTKSAVKSSWQIHALSPKMNSESATASRIEYRRAVMVYCVGV